MIPSPLQTLIRAQRRRHAQGLVLAAACAAVVGAASTLLLGLSGWFITASALAGAGGLAAAQAFNVLLPSAAIRLLAILRTGARYAERLSGHIAALRALAAIRPVLFSAMAASPPGEALALSSGEASSRLVQDVDAVETRFVRLSAPWGSAAAVMAGVALAALAGGLVALTILLSAGGAILVASALARHFSAPAGREIQTRLGALKDAAAGFAAAAPELRAYGLEAWAGETLAALGQGVDAARLDAARARGWIALSQAATLGLATAAAIALAAPKGAALAALAGLAAAMAVDGISNLVAAFDQNGAADEAAGRLDIVLRHAPAARSPAQRRPAPRLHLLDEEFAPAERIAILGPSGAGKTTLLERLLILRPSAPGTLRIGDADLARLDPATARSAFSYAPQDAALIAGSVADNLRLAAPLASTEDMWAALHDAALDDRIHAAPAGLDAWLGDNGERLSGGERRRLALARAYLRFAPWLLLDEPTEGLDATTEALVLDRLRARLDRTGQGLVLVSHRPAPLAICDRRLVLAGAPAMRRELTVAPHLIQDEAR
jgi:ATP-binding cassette subfamily C protein CydC